MKRILFVLLLCLGAAWQPASAQVTQADSAAVLLGVANRLRAEGRVSLANSLIDIILERYASTPAAQEAQRLRAELRRQPEERSGKTELLVFNTIYGLALGAMVPAAFGADDPEPYGVGLIVGGPLGYFMGRSILRNRPVSEGQARAVSFGTLWGGWQGLGWTLALNIGQREHCDGDICYIDDPDGETLFKATVLGSVVGMGTGLYLARKEIPAGTATTVNFGAFWGTWYGVAAAVLADPDDDDHVWTMALLAGNGGLVASALLAPRWQLSRPRARLISIAGVAGGLAGAGALLIAQPDGNEAILVPVATSTLGLALGAWWTRNYDERAQPQDEPESGALLDLRAGKWSMGTPVPSVRLLETRENGRYARTPGISIPLLRAAF